MPVGYASIPSFVLMAAFIVISALPIWFAARVVGANYPTLVRATLALVVGVVLSVLGLAIGSKASLLLVPVAFLVSFKFILGTSIVGSVVLAVLALAGYAAMSHLFGASPAA